MTPDTADEQYGRWNAMVRGAAQHLARWRRWGAPRSGPLVITRDDGGPIGL